MGSSRSRGPQGPAVGSMLTGMVVGEAKRGILVEIGATALLLPRTRFGAAVDRIAAATYGSALTVEVVAAAKGSGDVGLDRLGIERSIRQPRTVLGTLARRGRGFELRPADGSTPFAAIVLDRLDPSELLGAEQAWWVGAPHRGVRLVEPVSSVFA